ncbi:MAG: sigma-70 family RNA polymerase sigma factor [Planctomycetota bacterium]
MSGPTTCWALLADAAGGDARETERFCALYRGLVVDFLSSRWRGSSALQDVEDAAQETLMECLRERGALQRAVDEAPRGFRAFLFGVTMNVARRFEERRARLRPELGVELPPSSLAPAEESTPEREFNRAWARSVLSRARSAFERSAREAGGSRERRCEILRLRFFENLPIRRIAEELGEEAPRVHREYARAREEFRGALEQVVRFESREGGDDLRSEMRELMAHLA